MINIYSYRFSLLLLGAILLGGITGFVWGPGAQVLQPLGTIFLHLLYTIMVPLIFFSVTSAIVNVGELHRLKRLFFKMFSSFFVLGSVAAIFMIIVVLLFSPTQGVVLKLSQAVHMQTVHLGSELVSMLTVPDLSKLFLPSNMLPLIIFALFVGLATAATGEKARPFAQFLQSGTDVLMTLISFVMYYAPVGFFAFFAVLVAKLGPGLLESYLRSTVIYYVAAVVYFFAGFTLFAYWGNIKTGVLTFWKNVMPAAMTALATCSSAASIPVNLQAVRKMGVSDEINETVIPIGTVLHKQGSILGGVLKVAFLFGIFHVPFFTPFALSSTWIVAILVGTVMGAIPSGGMLGEMLILSLYGFPPQALFIIATISIVIDPLATMLNVVGNTVCTLLVARWMRSK